jgi:hypothetical protein
VKLLASWDILYGEEQRTIQLLLGDLANLPREHLVDMLIVSAFANDYLPTPTSLIGALDGRGLSVAELAENKKVDLRQQFSCWLSQPVPPSFGFRQLVCIESDWLGTPPEICDDLFRALSPYLITDFPNASVAMPVLGAGDQGYPVDVMFRAILTAAVSWLKRGLPLRLLKIVVHSSEQSKVAKAEFEDCHSQLARQPPRPDRASATEKLEETKKDSYDYFLSYSRKDSGAAGVIREEIQRLRPGVRIFFDRFSIVVGSSWLMSIAEALDHSKRVIPVYSPDYWASSPCKDEFLAARTREYVTGEQILFPIYFRTSDFPTLFQNLQYFDCREADPTKLRDICQKLSRRG